MSFGSPAKLERIERHLSRQRGAGVRNFATSFGFSFGLPPTYGDEDDRPDGPTAKRRKLSQVFDEESRPAQTTGISEQEQYKEDVAKQVIAAENDLQIKANTKARRQFVAADEDEVRQPDVDDSFTKIAKKRGRSKKTDNAVKPPAKSLKKSAKAKATPKVKDDVLEDTRDVQVAEAVEEKLGRRPRRQAATSAMTKVTEGFVEEAAPIDKKRRDPEPEKTTNRGRKKATMGGQSEGLVPVASGKDPELERPAKEVRPSKRGRKKVLPAMEPVLLKDAALEDRDQSKPVDGPVAQDPTKSRKPTNISRRCAEANRGPDIDMEPAERKVEPNPKKRKLKATLEEDLASRVTTPISKRRPLAETHPNATMRSVSPEKTFKLPAKDEADIWEYVSSPKPLEITPPTAFAVAEAPKRKKKAARPYVDPESEQFEAKSGSKSTEPTRNDKKEAPPGAAIARKQTESAEANGHAKAITDSTASKASPSGPNAQKQSLETRQSESSSNQILPAREKSAKAPSRKASSQTQQPPEVIDDDVDWLFNVPADGPLTSHMRKEKKRKPTTKAPSSRMKSMVTDDMDLDDLLNNIATFAGTATTGKSERSARGR